MKRALSLAEARECENAQGPVCKCRCGGALHGSKRIRDDAPIEEFQALPADDAHHLPTKDEQRKRARLVRAIKRAHRWHRADVAPMLDIRPWDGGPFTGHCPTCLEEGRSPDQRKPLIFSGAPVGKTWPDLETFYDDLPARRSSGERDWTPSWT